MPSLTLFLQVFDMEGWLQQNKQTVSEKRRQKGLTFFRDIVHTAAYAYFTIVTGYF